MIRQAGGRAVLQLADLDPAAVAAMVAAGVREFGRLDVLVNNAAVRSETPFAGMTYDQWRSVLALSSTRVLCAQACLPQLARAGGSIVNIGGLTAHKGASGRARRRRQGGHSRRARSRSSRAAGDHGQLRGAGHHRHRARAAGRARAAAAPGLPPLGRRGTLRSRRRGAFLRSGRTPHSATPYVNGGGYMR
jgi:3-oxoacyl-[acyl-carrier protein] reductase